MTDTQLNDVWREITRTARDGARVIFRTAAEKSIIEGRLSPAIRDQWTYMSMSAAVSRLSGCFSG